MRSIAFFVSALTMTVGANLAAHADTITIANTTDTVAYGTGSNAGPTDYFDNGTSAVGSSIGSNFATSQLAITATATTNGNYSVDLQYTTLFSGSETLGGQQIYYPDIFLRSNPQGYSSAPFNYAISLGDEGANGGIGAGFYQTPTYLTSQQIWSNRSGFVYGGQYTSSTAYQPGQAGYQGYNAATVVTGGTYLGGVSVNKSQQGSNYILDVQLTLTAAEAAVFANGLDIFWGTGDCANGSFLASVAALGGNPGVGVPEPATLAVLAMGLLGLAFVRNARRA